MNSGRSSNATSVMRQDSANIATMIMITVIELPTTLDSTSVNALRAPVASVTRRFTSAPVWTRPKNAIGICWTCTNNLRRSDITTSAPIRAARYVCARPSAASTRPTAPTSSASCTISVVLPVRIPTFTISR